jgi:hypothetical protein
MPSRELEVQTASPVQIANRGRDMDRRGGAWTIVGCSPSQRFSRGILQICLDIDVSVLEKCSGD